MSRNLNIWGVQKWREYSRKVVSGRRRRVTDAIRSLVNARDLQFECARVLDEALIVPVLM